MHTAYFGSGWVLKKIIKIKPSDERLMARGREIKLHHPHSKRESNAISTLARLNGRHPCAAIVDPGKYFEIFYIKY